MAPLHTMDLPALVTATLCVALYGLAASGHFPADQRNEKFQGAWGAFLLWSTLAAGLLAAMVTALGWWAAGPWYVAVIGAGGAILFAPLLLKAFPDRFVDGRRGLVILAAGALLFATLTVHW
jgi:hypothetical protein